MKRIVLVSIAIVAAIAAGAPAALAGTDTGPKVALHLAAKPAKATYCTLSSPITLGTPCSSYNVQGQTKPAVTVDQVIYLVVAQVDTPFATSNSIAGATLGIEYNGIVTQGVDMTSWVLCADLEFKNAGPRGDWPASGGGNVITFEPSLNCQTTKVDPDGTHALLGAFVVYAYSDDRFRVTPNRNLQGPDVLLVADCSSFQTDLDTNGVASGWVGFGAPTGCNPCIAPCPFVPVNPTTWGKIKAKY